jgi:hypothetical protein
MKGMDVLYYPDFYPSVKLLENYLLFFDKVYSIIPSEINYSPPKGVKKFIQELPDCFGKISPKNRDIQFNGDRRNDLEKAFKLISDKKCNKNRNRYLKIKIDKTKTEFVGYTYLHDEKVTPQILDLLYQYNLLLGDTEEFEKAGIHYNGHWHIVDTDAANILVSSIADNIGYSTGLNTITDNGLDFIFNSVPSFDFRSIQRADTMLANAIIKCEIPKEIHSLNYEQYAEIRDNYAPIRNLFPEVISNLYNSRLKDIHDKKILSDEIKRITSEFHIEIQEAKKDCIKQGLKEWGFFSVASIITLGTAVFPSPNLQIPLIGSSIILNAVQLGLKKDNPPLSPKQQNQKLIGNMQKDIIRAKDVREYIHGQYPTSY